MSLVIPHLSFLTFIIWVFSFVQCAIVKLRIFQRPLGIYQIFKGSLWAYCFLDCPYGSGFTHCQNCLGTASISSLCHHPPTRRTKYSSRPQRRDSLGSCQTLNLDSFWEDFWKAPISFWSFLWLPSCWLLYEILIVDFFALAFKTVCFREENKCRKGQIVTKVNVFTNIHPFKNIAFKCHSKSS